MAEKLHWKTAAKIEREKATSGQPTSAEDRELHIFMQLVKNVMDLTGMDWREAMGTAFTISKAIERKRDAS
jgi:hypothetical protein